MISNSWVLNENIFSRLGEEIEDKKTIKEYNKRLKEIKEELNKKPNAPKLSPSTFELLERNIAIINDLEKKIEQLMKDKENIMKSMKEFSRLETQETKKAFRYLNENLGRFLRYFIQNSEALITEEYELKIRIKAWKNSLSELSGGQRSIVALCIIFTMLTYRAAPFYIFDEIDAALDINYTQGIGEIIKKEFKNAQFLIISLKNNMFENANRILRVYLQDQVTKVCRIK